MDLFNKKKISELEKELSHYKELEKSAQSIEHKIIQLKSEKDDLINNINNILIPSIKRHKQELKDVESDLYVQNVCLFDPVYKYSTSKEYEYAISECRKNQKSLIKNKKGVILERNTLSIEHNIRKGNDLLTSVANLMLTAFNLNCDYLIDKVRYNNLQIIKSRLYKIVERIEQNGKILNIKISEQLVKLKIEEIELVHECSIKKQQEKEDRQIQREILKEQERIEREATKERIKLEKEKSRLLSQMDRLVEEQDKNKIMGQILDIESRITTNEYRVSNQKCGYVYIISNNDLKDNMIKIGVTRQYDPMERIKQLSDASHAYKFNVHAFIWSEDAFKLESELHNRFNDKRVNLVNTRKELFYVELDELEQVLREEFSIFTELDKDAINEDFIVSENMRKNIK